MSDRKDRDGGALLELDGPILEKLSRLSERMGWNQHKIVSKAIELMWLEEEDSKELHEIKDQLVGSGRAMNEKIRNLEDKVARLEAMLEDKGPKGDE